MAFSNADADLVLPSIAAKAGYGLKLCAATGKRLTGVVATSSDADLLRFLRDQGISVGLSSGVLRVGCPVEIGGGAPGLPGADPADLAPVQEVRLAQPAGPSEPSSLPVVQQPSQSSATVPYQARVVRPVFLSLKAVRDLFKELPGISVMTSDFSPQSVVFVGSAADLDKAQRVLDQLDRCDPSVLVDLALYRRSGSDGRDRRIGVRLGSPSASLGAAPGGAGGLSLHSDLLDAAVRLSGDRASLVETFSTRAQAQIGEPLSVSEGLDVPVKTGVVVNGQQSVDQIAYRTAGQNVSLQVTNVGGGYVTGTITHEVSVAGASGSLGPSFSGRKVSSAFRVSEGVPTAFVFSSTSSLSSEQSFRILQLGKSSSISNAQAVLVLRLEVDRCRTAGVASDG